MLFEERPLDVCDEMFTDEDETYRPLCLMTEDTVLVLVVVVCPPDDRDVILIEPPDTLMPLCALGVAEVDTTFVLSLEWETLDLMDEGPVRVIEVFDPGEETLK